MIERIKDIWLSLEGIFYYFFFLKRSSFWSPKKIEQYQYGKLKKMLLVCETKVPYYQRLFNEIGFEVERDFKSINDLKKIPITTKDNIRKHYVEFLNPDYAGKSIELKTSGSTGEPLKVQISKNQWVVEQGIVWRHWKWNGYHFRKKMGIIRSYTPKNEKLIKYDKIRNFIYYSPYHLTDENMNMYLDHMIKEKVEFLRGYPSSLEALALYVLKSHHSIPRIKGILSASEVLTGRTRNTIEKAFNCKVTNWYGLAECIVTMGDCEKHEGLHVFEEYGYAEFLNTSDQGQKRIIGTNLHNYAMPLLRYETNDIAEIENECSCARNSRVVKNIIGRNNSFIKLKDRNIPITNFYTLMEHYLQVESWQIVQHGEKCIELILGKRVDKGLRDELINEYRLRLPDWVDFNISFDKEFIKKGEGKKVAFVRVDE